MDFFKFINKGRVGKCPTNGFIDSRGISNLNKFFELHPDIAITAGYKKIIIENIPEYDSTTQELIPEYEDTAEAIIKHWRVIDAPPIDDNNIDIKERILEIKAELTELEAQINKTESAEV